MKKQLFLRNAALLTATALVLRAAGMLFRIYIAGRIGDEGMGLYQLIFTLYNFGITLATTGVSVASTRQVSQWMARNPGKNPQALAAHVVRWSMAVGAAAGVLLFVAAKPAAVWLLKDTRAVLSLWILAPSLPFMAMGAALRGCFAACRNVKSSSASQIFEQVIRIGLVAVLLPRVLAQGTAVACAAVVVGNTVSEILSALYMAASWRRFTHGCGMDLASPPKGALFQYLRISTPVTATRGVGSLLVTAENMLVPSCLAAFLGSRTVALAQFGQLKAMAMPVLFFPFSFLATLSTLLLPEITEAHTKKDEKLLARLIDTTILITMEVSILMGGLYTVFSNSLGQVLYQSADIGFYLRVLGPMAPLMYLESMVDGILRGLGEQLSTFRYSVCDSVLRIIGVLLLVPKFGMKGFLLVMLYSNLFTCILNVARLIRVSGRMPSWKAVLVRPLCSLLAAWVCWHFAAAPLLEACCSGVGVLVVGMLLVSVLYLLVLWLMGGIGKEQLALLKGSRSHETQGEAAPGGRLVMLDLLFF